jgi:dihydroorotase
MSREDDPGGEYDVIVQGGKVLDPHGGLDAVMDIGIRDGRIAAMEDALVPDGGSDGVATGGAGSRKPGSGKPQVIDAGGKIVTPGLIDLHVHVFDGATEFGIQADPNCIAKGATTVCDAGSSGAYTFAGLKKYMIDESSTRIKAFLNIASHGMIARYVGELRDLCYADVERADRICRENRDCIAGVKVRMGREMVGEGAAEALKRAIAACEAAGLPLMVHPNKSSLSLAAILHEMRPGDILTHCFHGSETGILDGKGRVRPEVREARSRGILFDVGHGVGSFSFDVAESALAQGFPPGTISTDLHHFNLQGPVYDLATTLSKFLLLGMSLEECIRSVTETPAKAMGMLGEIGTLALGRTADIAIFDLQAGDFPFTDTLGQTRTGPKKLVPFCVLKDGRIYH